MCDGCKRFFLADRKAKVYCSPDCQNRTKAKRYYHKVAKGKRKGSGKKAKGVGNMARPGGKDRGIVLKHGKWWVRLYPNGRERWYRCDNKTQAKTLYGRLKAEIREGKYFPERSSQPTDISLRVWINRYLVGITSKGLRNMHLYGRFWSRLLGKRLLNELTADDLRHIQAKMLAKGSRSQQTISCISQDLI